MKQAPGRGVGRLGAVFGAMKVQQMMLDASGIPVDIEGAFAEASVEGAMTDVPEIGNAKAVTYDRTLTDNAVTSPSGNVRVGPAAFRSEGWLESTLLHESVHVDQIGSRWYVGDELGVSINEAEAYAAEKGAFGRFGLTAGERGAINTSYAQEIEAIARLGGGPLVTRVVGGNYTLP